MSDNTTQKNKKNKSRVPTKDQHLYQSIQRNSYGKTIVTNNHKMKLL